MGLIAVLIMSTLATVGLCYWYLKTSRNVREMQIGLNQVNRNQKALQSLAIDLNAYARQNRAIYPLLEQMNLRFAVSTNANAGASR